MNKKKNDLSAEELIKQLMENLGDTSASSNSAHDSQASSSFDSNEGQAIKEDPEQITFDSIEKEKEENENEGAEDSAEELGYIDDAVISRIYRFRVTGHTGRLNVSKADDAVEDVEEDDINRSISNAEKYISNLEERMATGEIELKANDDTSSEYDEDEEDEDDEDEIEEEEEEEEAEEDNFSATPDAQTDCEEVDYEDEEEKKEKEESAKDNFGELSDLASIAIMETSSEDEDRPGENNGEGGQSANIDDLDENDINLMMIFNRDEELREKLGDEEMERIMRSMDDQREMQSSEHIKEYESSSQTDEFKKDYEKRFGKNTIRLIGSLVFFVLVLIAELLYTGGMRPIASGDDVLYVLIAIQITLICGAIAYKELFDGFRALFAGRANPNSVLSVMVFFSVLYEIAIIAQSDKIGAYKLFNAPLALASCAAIFGSRLDLRREMRAFRIISANKPKYAVAHLSSSDSTLEKETFGSYLEEPDQSDILGVQRADFISRFAARSSRRGSNKAIIGMIVPIPVIAAIAFFAIGYFSNRSGADGLVRGLSSAQIVIMMALPVSIFVGYAFPFWCASKNAFKQGSAIIGEGSLDEYSKASVVTFNDRDVFPAKSVKVRSMHLFGTNRIDHVLYRASSVFSKLGGPLSDVFEVATKDLGRSEDVDIIEIGNGGVEAAVDGGRVIVGNADYLKVNGFSPAVESSDRDAEYSGQMCIMYVVIGDEIAAKMYIEYGMDPDFAQVMKALCRSGVCLGIRTFDPNLNDAMLDRRFKLDKYPVKIIRCAAGTEMSRVEAKVDSGIVSKKSPKNLLKALTLCDSVLQVTKTNVAIKIISMILAIIVVGIIAFFGDISKLGSIWILLYQIFWMIPMFVISILFI